jgi:competence protein ComGC
MRKFRKRPHKAFSLIECVIILLIIAIIILIVTPNMLRARMKANETYAIATLRSLAEAANMYKLNSGGQYPTSMASLINPSSGYLKVDYCSTTNYGYTINCALGVNAYTFRADPISLGISGSTTYTMTTGGVFMP